MFDDWSPKIVDLLAASMRLVSVVLDWFVRSGRDHRPPKEPKIEEAKQKTIRTTRPTKNRKQRKQETKGSNKKVGSGKSSVSSKYISPTNRH